MKKLIWIFAVVIVAGGVWWYTSSSGSHDGTDPLTRTAVVERGDLVVSISASGTIEPIEQVEVKSKASGEIINLPIEVGDYVQRGDLIARLDRETAQNSYDEAAADHAVAKVTLEQRQKELDRQQTLFARELSSESELDAARLAFEQANAQLVRAKATLSTAKERLDDTEIRAPIDGIILERPVEEGQIISSGTTTVTGGTTLCTIANMNQVYVVADVDETDIGKVKVGQVANLSADAFPDRQLEGEVLRIAPLAKVEQNITMFEVTTLVDNTDGLLKSGMNATVEVIMARADDALLIPIRAVEMKPPQPRPEVHDTSAGPTRQLAATSEDDRAQGGEPSQGARAGGMSEGERRPPHGSGRHPRWGGDGESRPRMVPTVTVRRNGIEETVRIRTGLTNLDNIEVIKGLAVGDTVVYSLSSGAMRAREEFRERMRSRASMSGMRSN